MNISNSEGIIFDNGNELLERIETNNYKIFNKEKIVEIIEILN